MSPNDLGHPCRAILLAQSQLHYDPPLGPWPLTLSHPYTPRMQDYLAPSPPGISPNNLDVDNAAVIGTCGLRINKEQKVGDTACRWGMPAGPFLAALAVPACH